MVARAGALQELWAEIDGIPGLSKRLGITEADLLESDPCVCLASWDVEYKILCDSAGVFCLVRSDRGQDAPYFRTDSARALTVQLAYRALSGNGVFFPGHSPYDEIPRGFDLEQREELDEYENQRIVVRWLWDERHWAEVVDQYSLLEGFKWAWMFTASDKTIANALALEDGRPLFRPLPGPKVEHPQGDVRNLTIEQWRAWRSGQLEGGSDG